MNFQFQDPRKGLGYWGKKRGRKAKRKVFPLGIRAYIRKASGL
jgi:hypothetical protein